MNGITRLQHRVQASVLLASICTTLTIASASAEPTETRPNVIIVMTDDQGYGDLGCHGNPILKTPNIDAMHDQSVRFTDFHVSPYCTPSRAALMTGNHPGYTGAYRTSAGRTMLHRDEKTIANLFADNGYATGMIGKWHLGDNAPHRPQDRGFQDVVWHRCGGVGQASDFWGNDYFDDTYERNGKFEKFPGYCTDVWFREGIRFVEDNQDKPFLLYLALNAPHGPYRVPPEWARPYQGNKDVANPNFYGMIANIDHNMGLLRTRLNELSLAENTILIFMTDNGTASGAKFQGLDSEALVGFNAGMRGKKSSVYDGGHRVPFFLHWPKGGFDTGRDIETLAAHIDVLPTLADLCNIPVSDAYQPDGINLRPLLENTAKTALRDHHILQFLGGAHARAMPPKAFDYSVVLTERWRLVNSDQQGLYDIQADPAQRNNVAQQHPDVVAKLRGLYQPFWDKVSPRLTPVRIDVGNPAENPTILCSQDWYTPTGNPPWSFSQINKLPRVTGPWMLEVKQAGRYRITLRQFPKEADRIVVAERAKIEIAGLTKEQPVTPNSKGVIFELDLPAGPTQLVTYLYDKNGKAGGAYFTDVEALSQGAAVSQTTTPTAPYDGSWESLQKMPVPAWFDDGKIGIFIHWGPYSAMGYRKGDRGYAEHVPKMLYEDSAHYYPWAKKRWGATPPDFGYKDIIPEFTAKNWDPDQWASVFKNAGAKYVVLTAEHHDGWANWDSDLTPWNAVDMGPQRDLVGDLGQAVRKRGLKYAPSYHRERHTGFFAKTKYAVHSEPRPDIAEEIRRVPEAASLYGPFSYDKAFIDDYVARWKEIQTKYQPDFLWVDDFPIYTRDGNNVRTGKMSPEIKYMDDEIRGMITDFMNNGAARGQDVYCNNKGANRNWPDGVGCLEKDNLKLKVIGPKWQSCTTFGSSFGYLAAEENPDYPHKKSVESVIHELVEVISRNGNFLINISPKADGTIPAWQIDRLREMGRWLTTNGEAIYGTRYWKVNEQKNEHLAFTAKDKTLYAIKMTKPSTAFTIEATSGWTTADVKSVRLLGSESDINWTVESNGLRITPPKELGPGQFAWSFEIVTASEQHHPNAVQGDASKALRGTKKVDLDGKAK